MSYNKKEHKIKEKKLKNIHSRKKWLILALIFFTIFALGGAGAWYYFSHQKTSVSSSDTAISKQQTAKIDSVTAITTNAQKIITDGGNIADAISSYNEAIKSSNDSETKSMLYLEKSTMCLGYGYVDEALDAALKSEAESQNEDIEQYIAGIYANKGDNQNAIKYYQKAIDLIDISDPLSGADAQSYRDLIKQLGGVSN